MFASQSEEKLKYSHNKETLRERMHTSINDNRVSTVAQVHLPSRENAICGGQYSDKPEHDATSKPSFTQESTSTLPVLVAALRKTSNLSSNTCTAGSSTQCRTPERGTTHHATLTPHTRHRCIADQECIGQFPQRVIKPLDRITTFFQNREKNRLGH